ncbi:MAG: class IV adenylate cyclase [Candidatus Uhrbacteria bacterium]|nr:class IV adenylate cyclase [Candidatus Uhrbacteria bacterium]
MREIEVLVQVHENLEKAREILERSGQFVKALRIHDVYLVDPKRSNLRPNEYGGLTEALRIRKTDGGDFLTHKIDHFDGKTGAWTHSDEQEIGVESAQTTLMIFKRLGFEELVVVDMERLYFETSEYVISLEDVKGLGLFMEVEARPTDVRDAPIVRKEIIQFIQQLGFETSKDVGVGKPELLLRKRMKAELK